MQAVEGDDWSSVIDGQTQQTLDAPASSNGTAAEKKPSKTSTELPAQIVSPFANDSGAQTGGGGLYSADSYELSVANVDMVLEEVRPYLIADGGNVEVVGVTDGIISLRLQGKIWMTFHIYGQIISLMCKVAWCCSTTPRMWTPIFEWCVVRCGSKNAHQKCIMFRRDWTTCSKYVNLSRLNC
jgi:hypothetical protein